MTFGVAGARRPGEISVLAQSPPQALDTGLLASLIRQARPKQWLKNVLVLAAPGAAGVLFRRQVAVHAVVAFVAFSLAASSTYFLNDLADAEADRRHPRKCHRPIASGAIGIGTARVCVGLLAGAAIAVGWYAGWRFDAVVVLYLAITVAYTFWLKHEPILDIAAVASGFVIRAIGGGFAARVPVSNWFLIVATFASLFMVAGKRASELAEFGDEATGVRTALAGYTTAFLRYVWMMSSGVAMTAYCLWAFDQAGRHAGAPFFKLSIVPFGLAILRYALLIERGQGGTPEDVVTGDRTLLILGTLWCASFGVAVLLGR